MARRYLCGLVLAAAIGGAGAWAGPAEPLPSAVMPLAVSAGSWPFNGAAHQVAPIDLPSYNYTEEEFLVTGRANVYDWTPDGDYVARPLAQNDYTTRIMVRRPADMRDFSGRVVVEVINMSADYDWTAIWAALWQRILANGDAYVGVTAKPNVFPGMAKFDPDRYGRLSMPSAGLAADRDCVLSDDLDHAGLTPEMESGLAWDMLTEIGALLKSDDAKNPLGVAADRLFFTGESQSGNYGLTYYKFFQPEAVIDRGGRKVPVYDGFLLEAATTPKGAPIRQCAAPLPEGDPQAAIPGRDAPLAMINSQWDFFPARGGARKPDADRSGDRSVTWELAGANHGWRFQYLYGDADHDDLARAGLISGDWSAWECAAQSPEVPLYMAEKALYQHLIAWVEHGVAPPSAPPIATDDAGRPLFDADGTAQGGLRLPMVAVPVASYGEGLAVLSDGCPEIVPFSPDQLQARYGSRDGYLDAYHRAAWSLVQGGYLLPEDAPALMATAAAVPFGAAAGDGGEP